MSRKDKKTPNISSVSQDIELEQKVALNPDWVYGEVQPSLVQIGEAYIHICNPKNLHLGVRPWCEVRVKKAKDAYLKVTISDKGRALQIANALNRSNGFVKNVTIQ